MSKNTLYLECYEGITGEMVLGALKELGAKSDEIEEALRELEIERITASAIWSDKGPTDAVGLAIAARAKGMSYVNSKDGTREPRTLRAMLIEEVPTGELWILESNIDDCAGEILGYTMDLLFEAGARDVWFTPIFMKKNRPAYQMSVLCAEEQIRALDAILFRETTTIGVRRYRVERTALPRRFFEVQVPGGTVRIKACELPDGTEKRYPEYEDVKRVARETGKSYREVYQIAKTTAEQS